MKTAYFVDDEQSILDGLRRMLRDLRTEWNLVFHTSAERALDAMQKTPPDVIVSDMRMPGMDGAEFLERVRDLYPSSIRFILSGHAELGQLSRAMRSSHQILTKPCEPELLRGALANAGMLCCTLKDPEIAAAIGGLGALPSIPAVLQDLMELLQQPEVDQRVVGKIIAKDPALSVRVLQIANSGFFAARSRVVSVDQAAVMIGARMLRNLLLHVKIVESFPVLSQRFSVEAFGERVTTISLLARQLAPPQVPSDDIRSLAMCSEVGQLVLASRLRNRYEAVLAAAADSRASIHSAERRLLGVTHAEVGAYLLAIWGQSPNSVDRVARHHTPSSSTEDQALLTALHVAECLVDAEGEEDRFRAALDPGLTANPDTIARWLSTTSVTRS